ncbi:hypothetical protein F1880_008452 [Penicillium rolfsii]|nr:hypothetical protein F1880_008452 [Penicillium rolfsii]
MLQLHRLKGPDVVIYALEHELARRSLWVLHRLDGGLAIGENDKLWGPYVGLMLFDELGYRYFNAVELGNVHYGFVGGSEVPSFENALTRGYS